MPPDAILVVDKPRGPTSRKVVSEVQRLTGAGKAGHAGTLDPIATGVLVVCLGRGTLLSGYLAGGTKEYRVSALLGVETDTYDTDGEVISRGDSSGVSPEDVKGALRHFLGPILQEPPPFSAVKHRGKPLYKYAREGVAVEPQPRPVHVESVEMQSFSREYGGTRVGLSVACGPGTYVRSLVHDVGRVLGCGACVEELRRTRSGRFSLDDAVTMEHLSGCSLEAGVEGLRFPTVPLEEATGEFPTVVVTGGGARSVGAGKPLAIGWVETGLDQIAGALVFRVLDPSGSLLALYGPPREGDGADIVGRAVRVVRPATLECEDNGTA